jgi:molybdate transport system ATP-binding protein
MTDIDVQIEHQYRSGFRLEAAFSGRHRVTALFGPSGSGKTTVLSCIAGLISPKAGRIALGGRTLFDSTTRRNIPARERRIGYVFQDHLLFPHLSAAANLRFGAPSKSAISFDAVVDVLELGGLLAYSPDRLSGGQKQRVALGRALLSNPELLLMDEPLASLDSALKERILEYLEAVTAEFRIPTLFVSHSQAEVRRLARWAVILDAGKVKAEGPPDEVLNQPAALELASGLGPVNLLRIERIEIKSGEPVGLSNGLEIRLPGGCSAAKTPVFVEFQPRDVLLAAEDVQGVSARNHFAGTVAKIVAFADKVFVAVDVGPMIWAEVTASAVAELQLAVGRPVFCLVKTQSLRLA